jgi:hypothetical protein
MRQQQLKSKPNDRENDKGKDLNDDVQPPIPRSAPHLL